MSTTTQMLMLEDALNLSLGARYRELYPDIEEAMSNLSSALVLIEALCAAVLAAHREGEGHPHEIAACFCTEECQLAAGMQ